MKNKSVLGRSMHFSLAVLMLLVLVPHIAYAGHVEGFEDVVKKLDADGKADDFLDFLNGIDHRHSQMIGENLVQIDKKFGGSAVVESARVANKNR